MMAAGNQMADFLVVGFLLTDGCRFSVAKGSNSTADLWMDMIAQGNINSNPEFNARRGRRVTSVPRQLSIVRTGRLVVVVV
jgi:hypothetical protein